MSLQHLIIGDVEGYSKPLHSLLKHPQLQAKSDIHCILVGDIVGKGPNNIDVIKYCYRNKEKTQIVLGNKDLLVQRVIEGEAIDKTPKWASNVAKKLDKEGELKNYFMTQFKKFIDIDGKVLVSHAPLINGLAPEYHNKEEIVGNKGKRDKIYLDAKGRLQIYGHKSRTGVKINAKNRSICIDSGCGKGRALSGLLIKGHKYKLLDSNGTVIHIKI